MTVSRDRLMAHIAAIADFTDTPGQGATRMSFSDTYRQACDYIADRARNLGLTARYDAIGNLRIRLEGKDPKAQAILIVSHLDTVVNGGDYDGVVGVVAGLEVLQCLTESGAQLKNSVELISFVEEEGASFTAAIVGSKALCGVLDPADLKSLKRGDGRSFDECARAFGCDPDRLPDDRLNPKDIAASYEIHIEQGQILEAAKTPIGLVTHIAGSRNLRVSVIGQANHAGTTPMDRRADALCGLAEIAMRIEALAGRETLPNTVATIGRVAVSPNAPNVIPGRVDFTVDVRDIDEALIQSARDEIQLLIENTCDRRGLRSTVIQAGQSQPSAMSDKLVAHLQSCAGDLGIAILQLHSGALHDSAALARLAPATMIFIPSRDGKSHLPEEWSAPDDIALATKLLLRAVSSH